MIKQNTKTQLNRVKRLIGWLTKEGKRGTALRIFNDVVILLKIKTGKNAEAVLIKALDNIKPVVGLRRFKKSGMVYWLPYLLNQRVSDFMAIYWLFKFSKNRGGKPKVANKLAEEILDAYNKKGSCIKEKLRLYELVNDNRVYLQIFFR